MLDEQQPRHLPAGRDFIRKRHPIVHPRAATTATLTGDPLTAPLTLTFISTLSTISTSSSTSSTSTSSLKSSTTTSSITSSTSSLATSSTSTSAVPTPSVSVLPTPSATPTGTTDSAMVAPSNVTSGLSGGAVAAISIGILVLVASAAVLVFRRTMQKRRQERRANATRWLTNSEPLPGPEKYGNGNPPMRVMTPSYGEGYAYTGTLTNGNGNSALGSELVSPAAPPASYNNLPTTAGFSAAASSMTQVTVRYTFVPNLPDELAISNGESLFLQQAFDDGWALCTNSKGDTGMVPLECLSSGSEMSLDDLGERSRRSSRRASSLSGRL